MHGTSTFHAQGGLFFQRKPDGTVRVIKTLDSMLPREGGSGNIVVDITLARNTWESVVRAMGEPHTFRDDGLEARAAFADAQQRGTWAASHHVNPEG